MIDLHHHFDGALSVEALYKEAQRRNLPQGKLLPLEFASRCRVGDDCKTLTDFLAVFNFFYDIAQNIDFLHEQAKTLPNTLKQQGLVYAETRFAPNLFADKKNSVVEVTEAVLSGLNHDPTQIPVRLILCVMRNSSLSDLNDLLMLYEKFESRGVCGIDLAGDESQFPCLEYIPIFDRAREMEIPVTIHAGEAAGPDSVKIALDQFHARRIGHGIQSIQDAELVRRLADQGIPLEVCLTSNVQTGNAKNLISHPFMDLYRQGVKVTINTDDPTVSGIDLQHEWRSAIQTFQLSQADQNQILQNSIDAAFCEASLKRELQKQLFEIPLTERL